MKPFFTTLNLLLFPFFLFSQEMMKAHRLDGPIVFDGKLDEAAWQKVPSLPLTMHSPNFGESPTEKTDVLLAYDEDYIYLGGRMYVSDPSLIRGTTFKRDAFDGTTDFFGLVLDTYNDNENGLGFFCNPVEMRWDATVFNDAQGDLPISIDWNGYWEVETTQDKNGWYAEMRIPLGSLRFQDVDGKVIMGVTLWRYIAAKTEVVMYPAIPPKWGGWSMWKPSQMKKFVFEGIYSKKPLYIAPYVLAGFQQTNELNDTETFYKRDDDATYEAGLDIKYGITSNLTLDLTVNTDFAQVEADDQQVNLTRFSLFFPEKRLFFQERASVFDFNFDDFNRLFYSRRIGIYDGNPVRIYGGARLVGRFGKTDLGFLNMQTAGVEDQNSENFNLLRIRKQVFNKNSYVGGIFTNRMDFKGNYNSAYGLDGLFRVFGDEFVSVKWVQSFSDSLSNKVFSLDPARIYFNWERRRFNGLSYNFTFSRAGRDYEPGMGFELRENYTSLEPRLLYGWTMGEKSKILRLQAIINAYALRNNDSGKIETANLSGGFWFETKNAWNADVFVTQNHEYVSEAFELSDEVEVPIGEYDFFQVAANVTTSYTKLAGLTLSLSGGSFYGGNIVSLGLSPRWNVSSHLELTGFYQYNQINFPDRNQSLNTQISRLRALYMLNTKFSIAAFLQHNSLDKVFVGNIRLRYNPKEGTDLFIVYNDLIK